MPVYSITVQTNYQGVDYDDSTILQAIQSTLISRECPEADIDVILVDDEYLREVKAEFFGTDQYTDVIAFRLNEYEESYVEGEIYVSLDRAAEQAMEYEVTADMEILRLVIHGTLHLLGFEDATSEKKHEMTALEDEQLKQFHEPEIIKSLP